MRTSLSFHGTHSEVMEWINESLKTTNLNAAAEYFFPTYRVVNWIGSQAIDNGDAIPNRISLHTAPVDLNAQSTLEFVDKNQNAFTILIGLESGEGIRDSILSAVADDPETVKVWRKLRRQVRNSLNSGAWMVNKINGSRVRDESHLYTSGARRLQDEGIPSLGPSDWIVYELD